MDADVSPALAGEKRFHIVFQGIAVENGPDLIVTLVLKVGFIIGRVFDGFQETVKFVYEPES